MDLVSQNMKLIEEISNESSSEYIDLPSYFRRFQYPVSLELSKYAGQRAYQRGMLDSLEFFCILTNKVYTRIIAERKAKGLVGFILKEKEGFSKKASQLILSIKKWECGQIDDDHLAQAIENFCLETTGVRLPVVSFFLRMLLPQKFGTLDIHATNALKIVGFKGIREIPKERAKEDYFEKYSGIDYLEYNALLTEIGKHYFVVSRERKKREMYPSEVDMALYMLDKAEPRITRTPEIRRLTKQEKIDKIMGIIEEILEGAITTSERPQVVRAGWAGRIRGSAKKLERNMRGLARQGNLTGMIGYYENAMKSFAGKRVAAWLDKYKMKTLENQHAKVKEIYNDC